MEGKTYLIKNVKSIYVLKNIFSCINQFQKLLIIQYNKEVQNRLNIDIENFKKMSGIHKEGERNGKGKEYILNTSILIFEGQYKDGKKSGKSKEYYEFGRI